MSRNNVIKDIKIITDTSFEMIKNDGIDNFSTRKLAEKLGVSKYTVYNYFANKKAIIKQVIEKFSALYANIVIKKIGDNKDYYKKNIFKIYPLIAEVGYDLAIENGDIYILADKDFSYIFEAEITVEKKFELFYPVFSHIFGNFQYSDHEEFKTQYYLDIHTYFIVLINRMLSIEVNRINKIGKDEFMRLIHNAYYIFIEKDS